MTRRFGTTSRIVVAFILFYTIATLVLGVTVYVIGDIALRQQLDDRIGAEVDYLADYHARRGMERLRDTLRRRDDRGVNPLGYLLIDPQRRRVGGELDSPPPALGLHEIRFRDEDGADAPARALTVRLRDGSHLTVAMELAPALSLRRTAVRLLLFGFGAMLLGGIAGGVMLIRAIRSRLNVMNDTAQAIISGDMTQRVPTGAGNSEFDRLAATLNAMLDRNSALIDNLRQVSSDIAHDLRTPLARLRQRLERIAAATAKETALRDEVEQAIEEADSTLSLFGALLRIAEVESGTLKRYFQPVDISATARRIAESYAAVAEDSGRSLSCMMDDDVVVSGDTDLLSQMLVNLLENAIRHTPIGTHIGVTVHKSGDDALLTVTDDGVGVPSHQWGALTRRFTRGDRSRNGPGFGLGLNLVNAVVQVHDGVLEFADLQPGLSVSVNLPISDPSWPRPGAGASAAMDQQRSIDL